MNIINQYGKDLYLLLCYQGFLPDTAKLITAQAAHESGNFTSSIFIVNNNPFGMKHPEVRKTTSLGENRGYAYYMTLESAVQDYWLYYKARKYPYTWKDADQFVEALKERFYFEAPLELYKKAVKHFYKLYFSE